MDKIKIGISIGDMNGVGLEVILKTVSDNRISDLCTPIIYGSSKVVSYHKNIVDLDDFNFSSTNSAERIKHGRVNVVNCWEDNVNINIGELSEEGGKYAYIALDKATADLKNNLIDGLVTAPINKKAMQLANFPFPGHTEYLAHAFDQKSNLMLMVADQLRIGLVCNHVPLKDVAKQITKDQINLKLKLMVNTLKKDFGIDRPMIALLALNPHASDGGLIGDEEEKIIRPVIIEAKKKGMMVMGPFPADGFFGSNEYKKFDGVLAMYHDQGLIPFKALSFGNGINFTAGLRGVRTSPDHGTAYNIAGKNMADPSSFRNALFLAIDIVKNRRDYADMSKDPLKKRAKHVSEKG